MPQASAADRRWDTGRRPHWRWRFLAGASAVLDGSLELEETLANTVQLAVPRVADYCVVALRGEDGSCRWARAAHRDAAGSSLLDRTRDRFPLPASSGHPLARAIRTGTAELLRVRRYRAHLDTAGSDLAPVSAIVAPMTAGGRTLGAILFAATARSQRRYGGPDLELAIDLGRRAGFAVDHALRFRAAADAARLREELMAMVAHDLKNPVATIDLALRVLLEVGQVDSRDAGEHRTERRAIGAIQRAAGRMDRLIGDLLDRARAASGQLVMKMAPTDAAAILADAVEAHATLAEARGITLQTACELRNLRALADGERIAQVFSNLVGNALQFTPRGGRVRIGASAVGTGVRFFVEDTGPGIATEHLGRVFDRFWQAQDASHRGSGLGLSIARAIVEAHGSGLAVDSTPGAGCRFHFTLRAVPLSPVARS